MAQRTISKRIAAIPVSEGAGVLVHRTIGTPALRHLDPFLMLDHFSNNDPKDYIAGFPDHPHRGFNTFTYMLDGHMLHQDSMGNRGDLRAGGAQWMKAASGIIHSEMPQQTDGLMRGFQLWINLPAQEKMSDPGYQEYSPESFPVAEIDGGTVKVIMGQYGDQQSPIHDPNTRVQYLDVALKTRCEFRHTLEPGTTAFLYVFEGNAEVAGTVLDTHNLAVLGNGDEVEVKANEHGTHFILVAGHPLNEPIVQYGPFVMTNREEIEQALDDYRRGRLVQKKASFSGN
ncbi:MAG: pirin family protein [Gammaproteobacteria bacterium]|jgi:redox-sensitive bicupin YhaK (pirin superfamily)